MLNQGQIQVIGRAVNSAMGLLEEDNRLGHTFVKFYVVEQAESHRFITEYQSMRRWWRKSDFRYWSGGGMKFGLTPDRYRILISILECLQATLGVELLNEGGDKPLPPQLEGDK